MTVIISGFIDFQPHENVPEILRSARSLVRTLPLHHAPSLQSYMSELRRVATPHPTRMQSFKRPIKHSTPRESQHTKRV